MQRLEDVCRVVGIDFGDLARALADEHAGVTQRTAEQEKAIVSDPKLFLVALCAVGNWTLEQIVDTDSAVFLQVPCIRGISVDEW